MNEFGYFELQASAIIRLFALPLNLIHTLICVTINTLSHLYTHFTFIYLASFNAIGSHFNNSKYASMFTALFILYIKICLCMCVILNCECMCVYAQLKLSAHMIL